MTSPAARPHSKPWPCGRYWLGHLRIKDYRQVFFKPYRLIHRVMGNDVVVFIIADGWRDMQALLGRRLLGA